MQSDVKQWNGMKCKTINELWSDLQCSAETKRCTHMCAFLTFSASPGNGPYETVRPISGTPTKDSGSRSGAIFFPWWTCRRHKQSTRIHFAVTIIGCSLSYRLCICNLYYVDIIYNFFVLLIAMKKEANVSQQFYKKFLTKILISWSRYKTRGSLLTMEALLSRGNYRPLFY